MSPSDAAGLPGRWPLPSHPGVAAALLGAWGSPDRYYHDQRHLAEMLDRLDELPVPDADRVPVALAAWFHDAVYDREPGAEERSALWAESALDGLVTPGEVREVARLVRLTEHHTPSPGDAAGAAVCDADLAILASSPDRYAESTADIRREYAHLDDDAFRRGRTAVLEGLLARVHLFTTPLGRRDWELLARVNLTAELGRLRS